MTHYLPKIGFAALLFGLAFIFSTQAAEIRLKKAPVQSAEPLITLADIADIVPIGNENVESLRQIVLFPAPGSGETRTLDQWAVRTILGQLGVNTLHHIICGADKVTLTRGEGISPPVSRPINPNEQFVVQANYLTPVSVRSEAAPQAAGLTEDIAKLLEKQITQALNIYLNFTCRIERNWDIPLKLTPDQIRFFASSGQIVEITGGQPPFTGPQQFHIRMQNNASVTVNTIVTLPTEVVVVRRALPKGHIIGESDVMLQQAGRLTGEDFFIDVKSTVGKETTKAVRELTPLTQSAVRSPLWVRRGDIVTVRAVNGGIAVRTEATSLHDGAEGDTITVAKIDLSPKKGKKEDPITYLVRVCAPKTAEVFVK